MWLETMVLLALFFLFAFGPSYGQTKQMVQVKAFDQGLAPYKNIEISVNQKDFISVGNQGVAFIELFESDFPLKSIRVKDEKLEAASWNYSKGILEVIIRKRSYQVVGVLARHSDGSTLSNVKVVLKGKHRQQLNQPGRTLRSAAGA